jgi:hypothetical protein
MAEGQCLQCFPKLESEGFCDFHSHPHNQGKDVCTGFCYSIRALTAFFS